MLAKASGASGDEREAEKLQAISELLMNLRRGVFRPLYSDPLLRAGGIFAASLVTAMTQWLNQLVQT